MYSTVRVSDEINLPHFPDEIDRSDIRWQSKRGLDVYGDPYFITADGRLEQKQKTWREKTDEEKMQEAKKWGFDSWGEYVAAYDAHAVNDDGIYPDAVEWDEDEDGYDERPPTVRPKDDTIDEVWWGDQSYHGTFEFHHLLRRDPVEYEEMVTLDGETVESPSEHALDVYLEYEARFTKGDLDGIVFIGDRFAESDPVQTALHEIEKWREWRDK
jgi:hypothetical protein